MALRLSNGEQRNSEEEKLLDTYVYLDNVTVAGQSREKHDYNVITFLAAIRQNNFTLNENKTIAAQPHVQILG